ncbi:hypothetical protein I6F37_42580, partial [Bradyrhizobium sp. NBAIM08]|nr:hypothetical protein [Bradyrhizobium sp. NBAIM08]
IEQRDFSIHGALKKAEAFNFSEAPVIADDLEKVIENFVHALKKDQ